MKCYEQGKVEHPEWMEQTCELCGRKPKNYKEAGEGYRNTTIGKLCPDCFPTYHKIHKLLAKYYRNSLTKALADIVESNITYDIVWKNK